MSLLKKSILGFSVIILFFYSVTAVAQTNSLSQQNLAAVNVDDLSDEQIKQFINQAQLSGLTVEQLQREALSRGLRTEELQKLQARIEKITAGGSTPKKNDDGELATKQPEKLRKDTFDTDKFIAVFNQLKPRIFGAELFTNKNLSFEPNLKLPTPKNYTIGPDDELIIDIWGASQQTYKKKVSPEGSIRLELVGPVFVNGLTIEQASQRIITRLGQFYSGLRTNPQTTFAQVSIGTIRTIKVSIIGEATLPGTYSLPSLASVFNALYACGGPSENGSYRNIEVIRNNKVIRKLDVYSFMVNGDQKENIRLEDQDIIRIQAYTNRVELVGEIKRPGFYEAKQGESLDKLIEYAGGFTNAAYSDQLKLTRNTGKELNVQDVSKANLTTFMPQKGDKYTVGKVLDRFQNRIQITGAVFRPGSYSLENNATVATLIKSAEGVREDALLTRAVIYRKDDNLNLQVLAIDLGGIITGKNADISLLREDSLIVYSSVDLQEAKTVSIDGYVQNAGKYAYAKGSTVEDVILQAGGLKEGASTLRIEVSRRIISSSDQVNSSEFSKIMQVDILPDFSLESSTNAGFKLEPFDVISVRRLQTFVEGRSAFLDGEVAYPGTYGISTKTERISELISRAGGLTTEAYPEGAYLVRKRKLSALEVEERTKQLKKINKSSAKADSAILTDLKEEAANVNEQVGINLPKILKRPGSKYDLILQDADMIKIPTQLQTVKLSGEVLYPVSVRYESGKRLKSYIGSAGGFSDRALRKRSYVIYANGSVKSTTDYVLFKDYPRLKPGAEVFVPAKQRKESNIQQTLGITTAIASLALIVVTLSNTLK